MELIVRRNKERRIAIILNSELAEKLQRYKEDDFFTLAKYLRKLVYNVLDGKLDPPDMYVSEEKMRGGEPVYTFRITNARYDEMMKFIEENNYNSVNKFIRSIVADYLPDIKKKHDFETN